MLFKYFIFFVFVFFSVFLLFQNIQHKTKNAKEVNIWFSHTSYASLSIIQIQLELSKFYAKGTVRPNFNSDDINFETKRASNLLTHFNYFSQLKLHLNLSYSTWIPLTHIDDRKSLETTSNSNGNVSIDYISPTQKRWTYLLFLKYQFASTVKRARWLFFYLTTTTTKTTTEQMVF